jgi:hypothetical protein
LSQKTEDRKSSATDVSGQQREHLTKGPGDGPPSPNNRVAYRGAMSTGIPEGAGQRLKGCSVPVLAIYRRHVVA